jgi:hypothetical protein
MDEDQADQTKDQEQKITEIILCRLVEPTLFVTDAELIRRIGVPEKIARAAIHALERDRASGFPPKKAFWGNRRYWPAVKAYLDRTNGLKLETGARPA